MITLYTTNCPQCTMLKQALTAKNIAFDTVYGEQPIIDLGFNAAPLLKIDDKIMTFAEAVRWVNAQEDHGA